MKIYLTRHGETEWNIERRIQSWLDSPLTEKGVKSSEELRDKLLNVKFDKIYTSSIGRAVNTANIIRGEKNIEIQKLDGLREINLERWNGQYYDDFQGEDLKLYDSLYNSPHKYEPKENETYLDFYNRVKETVDYILKENNEKDSNILIVSHLHTLRAILAYLNKIEIKDIPLKYIKIKNNEILTIEL